MCLTTLGIYFCLEKIPLKITAKKNLQKGTVMILEDSYTVQYVHT